MVKSFAVSVSAGALVLAAIAADPVDWVDPTIGATSHMLVPAYPTVSVPFGMFRFSPPAPWFTVDEVDDIPLFLPSHRAAALFAMRFGGGVRITLDNRLVSPYSFSARVDSHGFGLRLVPTAKGAAIRFDGVCEPAFRAAKCAREGRIVRLEDSFRGVPAYLYGEFARDLGTSESMPLTNEFRFAVSWISPEQAEANFRAELAGRPFDEIESSARAAWNAALGRIAVEGVDDSRRRVFYTALYRCHERMIDIAEDGRCRGWDGKVKQVDGRRFTDDWSWDTYRAFHPLFCILDPAMQRDRLNSYLAMASESKEGWVPTFPNVASDGHNMNSFHPASMFLDARVKGVEGVDWNAAWKALAHTERTASRLPWYRGPRTKLDELHDALGYFPALQPDEKETDWPEGHSTWEKRQSVAVTLGYAYDCWCIAELGKLVGADAADIAEFSRKAGFNRNLFHPETRFFHPKDARGEWIRDVDYTLGGGLGARMYYDENNGWTYAWDAPHDIAWLVEAHGGPKRFCADLDALFNAPLGAQPWEYVAKLPDATGRIGQFVAGNEPGFHIPYLYNFCGRPDRTQKRIRQILDAWFRDDAMGLPGDEDGGGMSAFIVFSMLGFYPVTPGLAEYQLGSPVFEKATVRLGNGGTFTILAPGASREAKYWTRAEVGGKPISGTTLRHSDVIAGTTLAFTMADSPARADQTEKKENRR